MNYLKQSTAATLKVGPFVDDTDGKTAETALTISQSDVRLSKNGGNMAQKNEATSATHDELGYYDVPIDATDTNTLGTLQVIVTESGALPVWQEYLVVTANVYDTLCSTDTFDVNTATIATDAITAAALKTDAVTKIQNGLATPTNITAGTITTVTNLTNAPTSGDFTATMKTSLGTAVGTAQTGDSFARLGAPAGASVSADIAAIEAQTDDIGVAGAGLTAVPWNAAWDAEVQSEVADALNAYDPPTKAEMDAKIEAHLDAITTGTGVKVASMAVDAITASSLAATATAEIADAVLDEVVLGSYTLRQLIRGIAASQLGKDSGGGTTTFTIRSVDDAKDVVVATVDANGNRTAITLDLT